MIEICLRDTFTFALRVRILSFWLGKQGFAARLVCLARVFFPRFKKTEKQSIVQEFFSYDQEMTPV